MSGGVDGAGAPQGLSWSWELDFDALMACLTDNDATGAAAGRNGVSGVAGASGAGVSGPGVSGAGAARVGSARAGAPGAGDSGSAPGAGRSGVPAGATAGGGEAAQRAVPAGREDVDDGGVDDDGLEGLEEAGGGRLPAGVVAGLVAERLAPGPDLAAWLASAAAAGLEDRDLAVAAGAWRRVASWAQARELAAVAQIASRAAARDPDVGTGADGRPARVPASAAAEVALELTMSQYGAAGWADLAVELGWRLAGTGAALAAGEIDLARARLIAEATGMLPTRRPGRWRSECCPRPGARRPGCCAPRCAGR